MAGGVDEERVPLLAVLLLIDDRAPGPRGIALIQIATQASMRGLTVGAEGLAGNAGREAMKLSSRLGAATRSHAPEAT